VAAARAVAQEHGWGGRPGVFVARDLVRCMMV